MARTHKKLTRLDLRDGTYTREQLQFALDDSIKEYNYIGNKAVSFIRSRRLGAAMPEFVLAKRRKDMSDEEIVEQLRSMYRKFDNPDDLIFSMKRAAIKGYIDVSLAQLYNGGMYEVANRLNMIWTKIQTLNEGAIQEFCDANLDWFCLEAFVNSWGTLESPEVIEQNIDLLERLLEAIRLKHSGSDYELNAPMSSKDKKNKKNKIGDKELFVGAKRKVGEFERNKHMQRPRDEQMVELTEREQLMSSVGRTGPVLAQRPYLVKVVVMNSNGETKVFDDMNIDTAIDMYEHEAMNIQAIGKRNFKYYKQRAKYYNDFVRRFGVIRDHIDIQINTLNENPGDYGQAYGPMFQQNMNRIGRISQITKDYSRPVIQADMGRHSGIFGPLMRGLEYLTRGVKK